jgi:hypothetical protein
VLRVRRSCVPVPPAAISLPLERALKDFQATRKTGLFISDLVRVPVAVGFWRSAVVVPTWCVSDLSPNELHTVVLHELEHLRRYDDWTNLFQRILGALFFFHPAVWWLDARLSLEREMACDDAVLEVVPDPKSYASCLVSLAEKSCLRRGLALAQAAVSRVRQLTARVTQILDKGRVLDKGRRRSTRVCQPVFAILMVAVVAGGASLGVAPQLVAFQSDTVLSPVSAASVGSAVDQTEIASELKPTPARWLVPSRPVKQTPSHKITHTPAEPAAARAENSTQPLSLPAQSLAPQPVGFQAAIAPRSGALQSEHASQSQFRQTQPAQSQLAQTQPAQTQPAQAQPARMLVMIIHTEQRDQSGAMLWSVRVVRWMVFHPQTEDRVVDPQIPAKT